jgi:YesN/AraC family two-component response regulator
VHSFTNPKEALNDIEKRRKKKVSMLITDVRMPLHSGFEIARRTKDIVPDVTVVFMTAFEINSPEFDRLSLHSKSVTFCKNLSVRNN